MNEPLSPDDALWFAVRHQAVLDNVHQAIRGKDDVVRLALACLFAEGHLLIEDVPGVGKTSLAKALASSMDATWHRIQFTPDLLPSDITGVSIWDQEVRRFEYREGPVFANVVVADEINRASPKTQSALLEVMEERQVTVESKPRAVPRPFLVIATENPIDLDGTYRLPEAQLDRFLLRTRIGYPDEATEASILVDRTSASDGGGAIVGVARDLQAVVSVASVRRMTALAERVHLTDAVAAYIVRLAAATRTMPSLRLGASPRGSIALARAAQARAIAEGRTFVTPQDVKVMAVPVMAHRLILTSEAELQGLTAEEVMGRVLESVAVPAPAVG